MGIRLKLALAALTGFSLFGAEPRWIRLKSADFDMYTTAREKDARETLRYFEQVRAFFVQGMGDIPGKPLPVRIIGFNSKKEYEPYSLNTFATAYYRNTPTGDDIVLSEVGFDVFPVAVHEYVHLVVKHMGLKLPPWLNEGMAELYSTLQPMGDKVLVGTLIEGRRRALLADKWVPLKVIVTADQNSPYYNEKNTAGSLYNEGWALTHMLVLTNEYRSGFEKFMKMVSAGTPTGQALQKVYGKTIEEVDKELQAYLHGTHFQGAYFAQKLSGSAGGITTEPASAFDVKLVLADLLNRPGKEKQTREAMEQLASEDPKRPEPFSALAYLAWRAGDNDEAAKEFGKAFELGDKDPAMLWDYARMVRGRNQADAIRVLSELLKQEPDRIDVRMELAADQLTSKQPGAALDTLKLVKKVTPDQAPRLFAILANAQMDLRQWDDAKVSAQRLKEAARTDDDRFQADRMLQYLAARAGGKTDRAQPALQRLTPELAQEPAAELKTMEGSFIEVDCSGTSAKMVIETPEGNKTFLIEDPHQIPGDTIELACGPQKGKIAVIVEFIPANQAGVDGVLRKIQFAP